MYVIRSPSTQAPAIFSRLVVVRVPANDYHRAIAMTMLVSFNVNPCFRYLDKAFIPSRHIRLIIFKC